MWEQIVKCKFKDLLNRSWKDAMDRLILFTSYSIQGGSKCRHGMYLKCIFFSEMLTKSLSEWNNASLKNIRNQDFTEEIRYYLELFSQIEEEIKHNYVKFYNICKDKGSSFLKLLFITLI